MPFIGTTVPLPLFYDEHQLCAKRPNFLSEIMFGSYIITLFTERKERMPIVKCMSVRLYVIIQEPLGGFE